MKESVRDKEPSSTSRKAEHLSIVRCHILVNHPKVTYSFEA